MFDNMTICTALKIILWAAVIQWSIKFLSGNIYLLKNVTLGVKIVLTINTIHLTRATHTYNTKLQKGQSGPCGRPSHWWFNKERLTAHKVQVLIPLENTGPYSYPGYRDPNTRAIPPPTVLWGRYPGRCEGWRFGWDLQKSSLGRQVPLRHRHLQANITLFNSTLLAQGFAVR